MRVCLALVAALALPGVAQASTTIVAAPDDHRPFARWVRESRVPTPDVTLRVIAQPCHVGTADFAVACTTPGAYSIRLARGAMRGVFLHEMGHNFDYYALTPDARATYMRHARLSGPWWRPDSAANPSEAFADHYGLCAMWFTRRHGKPRFGSRMGVDESPGMRPQRMGRICRLIRAVG